MLKRLSRTFDAISRALKPMSCARAGKLIPLHVAGDLPARHAQTVARHLGACALCRAEAEEYAASRAWLQAGAQAVFADEFYAGIRTAVLSQIRREQRRAPFFAPFSNRRLVYAAASLTLICVVSALAWHAQLKRTTVASYSDPVNAPPVPTPMLTVTPSPRKSDIKEQERDTVAIRQRPRRRPSVGTHDLSVRALHEESARTSQARPAPVSLPPTPAESGRASDAAEVARIEIQTADPNIRIIWLAPQPAAEQPKQEEK